jgi:hypothetical protein
MRNKRLTSTSTSATRNGPVKSAPALTRRTEVRKKWTEKELLTGVTPAICGPELIADRVGRELL